MSLIQNPSFEHWLDHAFNHPMDDLRRYQRMDFDHWLGEPLLKAKFITETFENANIHLARFSDAQLESAIWFVLNGDYTTNALGPAVPIELRLRLLRSTIALFQQLFFVRLTKLDFGGNLPLYRACYMFWEIFPLRNTPKNPEDAPLSAEKITVLERILDLENPMCQYAALHGLGHAQSDLPDRVIAILDAWLERHKTVDSRLREYAMDARKGDVQ